MSAIRARVINGRLQLDSPTLLPEGTVIDLVADDEGDDLGDVERAALNGAIQQAWETVKAGQARAASEVIDDLRKR